MSFDQRAYQDVESHIVRFYPSRIMVDMGNGTWCFATLEEKWAGNRLSDELAVEIWNTRPRSLEREGFKKAVCPATKELADKVKLPYTATGTGGKPPRKLPKIKWQVDSDGDEVVVRLYYKKDKYSFMSEFEHARIPKYRRGLFGKKRKHDGQLKLDIEDTKRQLMDEFRLCHEEGSDW